MKNQTNSNKGYTYIDFANEAIALANGYTVDNFERFVEKANDLIATQENKKAYNATHPKTSTSKGASAETKAKAELIESVLNDNKENALTATDINLLLETDFTALQVANAAKFIDGVVSIKVMRMVENKGLKAEKMYTGYYKG